MRTTRFLLIVGGLLGACSAPSDQGGASAPSVSAPAQAPAAADSEAREATAKHASATGTIESIDLAARTVTIAHGPVPELGWPAMTMTFQASGIQLSSYAPGDRVAFDLTVTGMGATVTALRHQ